VTPASRDAGTRLRRLLAVLAVLAREGRVPIADLAARFAMSTRELVADLELAACCGLPPYTPDQLMEIVVDDEQVVARLEPALAQPRRLTPAEGLAVATAARAILAVPGADPDGALARALAKLDRVLVGRDGLRVELDEPPLLAEVRAAVAGHRQLRLRYHAASRDEVNERTVDPARLLLADGVWYLDAFCHRAGGLRRFRVDRMLAVEPTGVVVEPPALPGEGEPGAGAAAYLPSPDATLVTLEVDEAGRRRLEGVPVSRVDADGTGRYRVELPVSSPHWLGRLLVQLGPTCRVVAPAELADVGAATARRILARYGVAEPEAAAG
jgi:proteasome accessory factor C